MEDRGDELDQLNDDETGPTIMRRYAQRLQRRAHSDDGIAAATARTYYRYIRGCLSWGVRDGRLDRNPALPDRATEELPETTDDRSDQQHWSVEERDRLLEHVGEQVRTALDDQGAGSAVRKAARDRALCAVLYYAAVRVGEVCRHRRDERRGLQGLRWANVDLDAKRIRIFGKGEQGWTWHPFPGPTAHYLRQLKRLQDPAADDWPVFATEHPPSVWGAAREQLGDAHDLDALVEEHGRIHAVLREYDIPPPALTTDGARDRLRTLTEQADIDPNDGDYLTPHGARRGMIGEVFKHDRGEAQDLGRHREMATTKAAYRHLAIEEQRERVDELLEVIEDG